MSLKIKRTRQAIISTTLSCSFLVSACDTEGPSSDASSDGVSVADSDGDDETGEREVAQSQNFENYEYGSPVAISNGGMALVQAWSDSDMSFNAFMDYEGDELVESGDLGEPAALRRDVETIRQSFNIAPPSDPNAGPPGPSGPPEPLPPPPPSVTCRIIHSQLFYWDPVDDPSTSEREDSFQEDQGKGDLGLSGNYYGELNGPAVYKVAELQSHTFGNDTRKTFDDHNNNFLRIGLRNTCTDRSGNEVDGPDSELKMMASFGANITTDVRKMVGFGKKAAEAKSQVWGWFGEQDEGEEEKVFISKTAQVSADTEGGFDEDEIEATFKLAAIIGKTFVGDGGPTGEQVGYQGPAPSDEIAGPPGADDDDDDEWEPTGSGTGDPTGGEEEEEEEEDEVDLSWIGDLADVITGEDATDFGELIGAFVIEGNSNGGSSEEILAGTHMLNSGVEVENPWHTTLYSNKIKWIMAEIDSHQEVRVKGHTLARAGVSTNFNLVGVVRGDKHGQNPFAFYAWGTQGNYTNPPRSAFSLRRDMLQFLSLTYPSWSSDRAEELWEAAQTYLEGTNSSQGDGVIAF